MVKKGQSKGGKPGGGGGTKKTTAIPTGPDDSFIVFSNSDKEPKPRKPVVQDEGSSAGLSGPALLGEAVQRPDVKKIIGGASWTGKLPVNMLSEHCQKQKWDKPEYTMVCVVALAGHPANFSVQVQNSRGLFLHGHPQSKEFKNPTNRRPAFFQTSSFP